MLSEIAPGVLVHTGEHKELSVQSIEEISNSGFIIGDHSVMMIDPGGSAAFTQSLLLALAQETELPVKHVVLTHFHPDHVAGASFFEGDVNIIAHHHYPRALLQRALFYTERFELLEDHWSTGRPTQLIDDSMQIDLGNRVVEITAHETAHTDNDLSVFDEQTKTLWASDLVFEQRTPSLDGSLNGWIAVLDALEQKQAALVVPGHGRSGDWQSTVMPQYQYLSELREEIRRALLRGTTLSGAIENGAMLTAGAWLLFDTQHPVNITKAYTELEWE